MKCLSAWLLRWRRERMCMSSSSSRRRPCGDAEECAAGRFGRTEDGRAHLCTPEAAVGELCLILGRCRGEVLRGSNSSRESRTVVGHDGTGSEERAEVTEHIKASERDNAGPNGAQDSQSEVRRWRIREPTNFGLFEIGI